MPEGYGIPIGSSLAHGAPKEVSLVSFPLHLRAFTRPQRSRRLQQAYASGFLKLVKRLQALLALAQDHSGSDVAERRALGAPTVREARPPSLCKGMASVVDHAPPGRPRKRTHTPRPQRAARAYCKRIDGRSIK